MLMKKLGLIIPLLITIPSFISFLCVIMFVALPLNLKGQVYGCHVQRYGVEVLYYIPYGVGSPTKWITTGVVDMTGAEGGF